MDQDGTDRIDGRHDPEDGGVNPAGLDDLIAAVDRLSRQVEDLGTRIERLEGTRGNRSRGGSGRGRRRSTPSESIDVVMRPVPELAMAAVAERALRRAEPVHSVEKADGSGDGDHAARFTVQVSPGTDLVGEVEKTLPVAFRASESESGALLFELKW